MSTILNNADEASALADKLGVSYSYFIPFTKNLDMPYEYNVVIPVYKNAKVDIVCARPTYLYPSECKIIDTFTMDSSDVIIFATRTTASFKATISCGGISSDHLWGQDWFPEELINEGTSDISGYADIIGRDNAANIVIEQNRNDKINPDDITDSWGNISSKDIDDYVASQKTITFDLSGMTNTYNNTGETFDPVKEMERYIERKSNENR